MKKVNFFLGRDQQERREFAHFSGSGGRYQSFRSKGGSFSECCVRKTYFFFYIYFFSG